MVRAGPIMLTTQASSNGSQEKVCLLECTISRNGNLSETEPIVTWESEDLRKQQTIVSYSMTDRALKEEALRYGSGFCSKGERALGGLLILFLFILIGLWRGSFTIVLGI